MSRLQKLVRYFQPTCDIAVLVQGARHFSQHIQGLQALYEQGKWTVEMGDHTARLNFAMAVLVQACEDGDVNKRDECAMILALGQWTSPDEVFKKPEELADAPI